jgi:hypothetical protein
MAVAILFTKASVALLLTRLLIIPHTGKPIADKATMIEITTTSSTKVKPRRLVGPADVRTAE